jgi:hypothetical protein
MNKLNKPFPCYCKDCKWSKEEERSSYFIRCHNPIVNAKDPHALGCGDGIFSGVDCKEARHGRWFVPCGITGKLWERK